MKTFHDETESPALARALVEVASLVMRRVRAEVRRRPTAGLTYTQMRALSAVRSSPGSSLSDVAEYLGLGASTASKVVDELVRQGLVERKECPHDRRRVVLEGTAAGARVLAEALEPAHAAVAEMVAPLEEREREAVTRALALLHPLLVPGERSVEESVDA